MADEEKRYALGIDLIESGVLQEVNRRFLHPLGLALAAFEGSRHFLVWDCRDDPEGIAFGPDQIDPRKSTAVDDAWEHRRPERERRLGYMVQPLEEQP